MLLNLSLNFYFSIFLLLGFLDSIIYFIMVVLLANVMILIVVHENKSLSLVFAKSLTSSAEVFLAFVSSNYEHFFNIFD